MVQRVVIQPSQIQNGQLLLSEAQQHYLKRVLRLTAGDRFIAMDGQGQAWMAALSSHEEPHGHAQLLEPVQMQSELPIPVTLVMALPKGSGFDDVVRQATELGVSHIVPVISDRTLLKPNPNKLERWQRIAQEAAEQSERQQVPTINAPLPLMAFLKPLSASSRGYFCATRRNDPGLLDCLLAAQPTQPDAISIMIGPEGGWTDNEVEGAIAAGYQPVSLGTRILRTVTAPLAALTLIAAVYEQQSS